MTATAAPRKSKPVKPLTAMQPTSQNEQLETDDELLAYILGKDHPHWSALKLAGGTDTKIEQALNFTLNLETPWEAISDRRPRSFRLSKTPQAIWFDQVDMHGPPTFKGTALIEATRRIVGIPRHGEVPEKIDDGKRHKSANAASSKAAAMGNSAIVILETIDVPLAKIRRSPFQTRSEPDKAWLQEVAASLRTDGQSTPGLGRWVGDDFELIAGHTRWAAAESIDWTALRCEVCDIDDATAARLVYLENAKRRELSPIDKANGLRLIADQYLAAGKTQAECAADVGISESQLSNMLRLLRLPEAWQRRVLAGELSIEQSRALVTWVDYPKVIDAFTKNVEAAGLKEGPLDKHHFERAVEKAIDGGSRPMGKDNYGGGCLFTPTEAERKELDIREVKQHYGPPSKRAFNVTLWNRLQNAAKEKKNERNKKVAAKVEAAKSTKTPKRARSHRFEDEIKEAWQLAYRAALAERLTGKKKLSAGERIMVSRLALFSEDLLGDEITPSDAFQLSPAAFEDRLLAVVQADVTSVLRGTWDTGNFGFEPLHAIAMAMGLNAVPYFEVTKATFEGFGDDDLVTLAAQMDLAITVGAKREALIDQIFGEAWPRDEVPALLHLPAPKKHKAKK